MYFVYILYIASLLTGLYVMQGPNMLTVVLMLLSHLAFILFMQTQKKKMSPLSSFDWVLYLLMTLALTICSKLDDMALTWVTYIILMANTTLDYIINKNLK